MPGRKLPIGIQTFRTIREEGCYYVDKTPWIRQLVDGGPHCLPDMPSVIRLASAPPGDGH